MQVVLLDGKEYRLRCDINALEELEKKYGSLKAVYEAMDTLDGTKEVLAVMVNEQFYYDGNAERVTAGYLGARMTLPELKPVREAIFREFTDCIQPKN